MNIKVVVSTDDMNKEEKQELFDSLYINDNDELDVSMVDSEIEATDFLDASIYKFKNSEYTRNEIIKIFNETLDFILPEENE